MKTKTKTLAAIAVAAVLGGAALAGASYAGHRHGGFDGRHGHGLGFLHKGQLAVSAMEMFDSIDANGDGNLNLEEFAGLWHETTRPLTVRAFQMLDTDGDAVVSRAEYDRPLAEIVERLDRDGDGGLSMRDRWHDDDDGRWGDDD
ncbi:MAG: EF-hand domain-containing protein [Chromatiales bacterium]|nr:EF-hand domain-containing protein [Chromatiales bacterium]